MDWRLVRIALLSVFGAFALAYWLLAAWLDAGGAARPAGGWALALGLGAGVSFLVALLAWAFEARSGGDAQPFATLLGAYVGGAIASAVLPLVAVWSSGLPDAAASALTGGVLVGALLLSPVVVPAAPWFASGPLWAVYFAPLLAIVGGVVGWFLASSAEPDAPPPA